MLILDLFLTLLRLKNSRTNQIDVFSEGMDGFQNFLISAELV